MSQKTNGTKSVNISRSYGARIKCPVFFLLAGYMRSFIFHNLKNSTGDCIYMSICVSLCRWRHRTAWTSCCSRCTTRTLGRTCWRYFSASSCASSWVACCVAASPNALLSRWRTDEAESTRRLAGLPVTATSVGYATMGALWGSTNVGVLALTSFSITFLPFYGYPRKTLLCELRCLFVALRTVFAIPPVGYSFLHYHCRELS